MMDILYLRYIGTLLMIWFLNKRAELLPPKMRDLQFGGYIKSGEELYISWWFLFSCYVLLKPELNECVCSCPREKGEDNW